MLNQNSQNNMEFENLPENVSLISVGNGLYRMIDTEDLKRLSRIRWSLEMENKQDDFRLIPLTQGKFAIVDAEDYGWLSRHKWFAAKSRETFYAQRFGDGTIVGMHREIMRAPKGMVCDHKNHDGLDNRKSNLRLCTTAQCLDYQSYNFKIVYLPSKAQFFIDDIMGLEYESYFGEGSIGSYGFSQDMVEFSISNLSFHSNRPRVQHLSDKMAEVHQLKN